MNSENIKVNVNSSDNGVVTVLTGPNFVQLKDCSVPKFTTVSIVDYVHYVSKYIPSECPIFVNEKGCNAFHSEQVYYSAVPEAQLSLSPSNYLVTLTQNINNRIPIAKFELLLRSLLDFADDRVLSLLNTCRNLDIKSITQLKRAADSQGNYTFSVSRDAHGDQKLIIPDAVSFNIPVFRGIPDTCSFNFGVSMDYSTSKEECEVFFQLMHYTWDDAVMTAYMSIISTYMEALPHTKYWGNKTIVNQTNLWEYQTL